MGKGLKVERYFKGDLMVQEMRAKFHGIIAPNGRRKRYESRLKDLGPSMQGTVTWL